MRQHQVEQPQPVGWISNLSSQQKQAIIADSLDSNRLYERSDHHGSLCVPQALSYSVAAS
jgi:hypothetical protein